MSEFYAANSLLINLIAINAILALSIYITLSAAMLSLANAAFMGIGAYTAILFTQYFGWPLIPAAFVGAGMAALVGALLGAPVLRLRGIFLAIATIGFGEILRIFILNFQPGITLPFEQQDYPNGAEGLRLPPPATTTGWLTYGTLLVLVYFFWRLRGSRMGLALAAIREDEAAAESSGINVTRYKLLVFVIGAAIAGWAGALDAHLYNFISPADFGFSEAVTILVYAVVGGTLGFPGPILGAALITALPEILRPLHDFRDIFTGLVLLLTILFLPSGLFSLLGNALGLRRRWQPTLVQPPSHNEDTDAGGQFIAPSPPDQPGQDKSRPNTDDPQLKPQTSNLKPETPLLRTEAANRRFGGVVAVDNVEMSIAPHSVYGLIGPNGAGKTTLLNLLSGVLPLTSGHIYLKGERIDGLAPHNIVRRGIARTYQNIRLFPNLSVLENVLVGMHSRTHASLLQRLVFSPTARREEQASRNRAFALLTRFGLECNASLPATALAYGDQRRLEMARALATDPTLLLLDEPAAGLNQAESERLRQLLRELTATDLTVLLIEHDMALVMSVCDRIAVINFGRKIAEDVPATISRDPLVIEAYLGSD